MEQRYGLEQPARTMGEYLHRWGFTPQKLLHKACRPQPQAPCSLQPVARCPPSYRRPSSNDASPIASRSPCTICPTIPLPQPGQVVQPCSQQPTVAVAGPPRRHATAPAGRRTVAVLPSPVRAEQIPLPVTEHSLLHWLALGGRPVRRLRRGSFSPPHPNRPDSRRRQHNRGGGSGSAGSRHAPRHPSR